MYESPDARCAAESIEESEDSANTDNTRTTSQGRADALALMAERSLQFAGDGVSRSDRYQVILHVDNSDLMRNRDGNHSTNEKSFPSNVPWIEGIGPIADSVANRMLSDASLISMLTKDGEPLFIGRKTHIWPTGMRRAILSRDRHCQFPGCTEHRYLDIHHIIPWSEQGETSIDNGVCLCHYHHDLVHARGYTVERNFVKTETNPGSKHYGTTIGLVSPVNKALLPTRYRFRFTTKNQCNDASGRYYVSRNRNDTLFRIFSTSRMMSYGFLCCLRGS